jgi:hypothetical protein
MIRRSFALAHEDDETRRALSHYTSRQEFYPISSSLQVQGHGRFFVSVSRHPRNEARLLDAKAWSNSDNAQPLYLRQVTNENTFEICSR